MAGMDPWEAHSVTSARQDLVADNNDTWKNAFQFGKPDDTTWSLGGQHFELDVKRNSYDPVPLLSISTADGRIITADAIQRVIYFDVDPADIRAALPPGVYVYDLIMIADADPTDRTKLMHGSLTIVQGVTYP